MANNTVFVSQLLGWDLTFTKEAHLSMHKPVAVLPAGHPGPSGAPAEQTTETSTSFSLQATVLSPVTMRNAAVPAAPGDPASP